MERYIVICFKGTDIGTKIFYDKLSAVIYDWEMRMKGYISKIKEY